MIRNTVYLLFFSVIAASVAYKADIIKGKEKKDIVSINREWEEKGKPVVTAPVVKGDAYCLEKISGIVKPGNTILSDVPENIHSKLRPGQKFSLSIAGKSARGYVAAVDNRRNMLTGLYGVRLKISSGPDLQPGSIAVARVRVETLKNILKIPQDAVMMENSHTFCWVVKNGTAHKKNITTGQDCENYIQVTSGLMTGEKVCISGQSRLAEGDEIRMVELPGDSP